MSEFLQSWKDFRDNIVLPTHNDLEKFDYPRAKTYKCISYIELIENINALRKVPLNKNFLKQLQSSYLNEEQIAKIESQTYVVPGIEIGGVFKYSGADLDSSYGERFSIGQESAFLHFVTLLKKWDFEKPFFEVIDEMDSSESSLSNEVRQEELLEWVNKYGLPLWQPISQQIPIPPMLEKELYPSDTLFNILNLDFKGIGYFMSLNSLVALKEYCSWLFFGSWMLKTMRKEFSREKKVGYETVLLRFHRKLFGEDAHTKRSNNSDAEKAKKRLLKFSNMYRSCKKTAGNQATYWIKLSPFLMDGKKGQIGYKVESLMTIMMLEFLSHLVNENAEYKICRNPYCARGENKKVKIFSPALTGRRADSIYCSPDCQEQAAKKRENARKKKTRQ